MTDVGCQVVQALMPIALTAAIVLVLLFLGAFGGKVGKAVAIAGIFIVFLWWFGLTWIGIPLEPLRKYAGQVIMAATASRVTFLEVVT